MPSNPTVLDVTASVAASRDAVGSLVDAVQADGLRYAAHDELAGLLKAARTLQARLEYVVLATVRAVDTRGSHVEDGALTVAAWTRMQTRMAPWEATAAVTTARALSSGEMPGTTAALAAGQIDPAHVRAIAAGAAETPPGAFALIEEEALTVAREADPRLVAALMRRFAHALDPDSADEAAIKRHDRRGITLSPMPDGTVHIRGLADEVNGAILATAIDAASPLVSGETRTAAQRRLDALAEICRAYLNNPDPPSSGGGHPHLIVTLDNHDLTDPHQQPRHDNDDADSDNADNGGFDDIDEDEFGDVRDAEAFGFDDTGAPITSPTGTPTGTGRGAGRGAGPGGTLSWVGPVSASTARRIGCDADVTYVGIDNQGAAQILGRQRRFFTWSQKKAMISRDGDRCCVPYCDRPISWADGHHIRFWANGGPTIIANGALPCAAHHPLFHEGGWTLHRQPDGRYTITRNNRTIGPEPHPPGHNRPPPAAPRQ
jgi:Domain of unknown function (DUF222)